MIDIQKARRITEINSGKPATLPRWVENYIDDRILDTASHGRSSLCLRFSRFEKLSDEEAEAVLEAYADYCPKHYPEEDDTFYFFWD